MRRRNQPKRAAAAPAEQLDTDHSSSAPSRPDSPDLTKSPVREVPLFKRRLQKGSGKVQDPKVILDEKTGRVSVDFPRTPYDQLDLSDSFLAALHEAPFEPKKTWTKRRRGWFFLGGLLGLCAGCVRFY